MQEEHFIPLIEGACGQVFIDNCRSVEVPETVEMMDSVVLFNES